ncbi:hypothetical protein [Maledivibacter halophilus]|uniref:Uncharacterized protein n=1 Tax=Maledivibacter halophilus TaxID=36842 RepID=A0A1T5L1H1_9FIRM|nr:hypothetical protein [Maledivibacter halophilus]SKC69801.1 hypothetical protein SAMN02194393_02307 [Maledivibacter halophilus]
MEIKNVVKSNYISTKAMTLDKSVDDCIRIVKEKEESGKSAKDFLATLSSKELYEIQKANHLAHRININSISNEGAENLFLNAVNPKSVIDLNNDGITEIGEAKMFVYPPPNAPAEVKEAWKEATKHMTEGEKMLAMGKFLVAQSNANAYKGPDGNWKFRSPGEEGWVNIFGTDIESYKNLFNKLIYQIDNPLAPRSMQDQKIDEFTKDVLVKMLELLDQE